MSEVTEKPKEQIYYIYKHTRLDNGEVFYIGRGKANMKGRLKKSFYRRAFDKTKNGRSAWWHRVAQKTEYSIEIICESTDKELTVKKETEFIKLYGRKDLGRGTLVNFTNGGDGPNEIKLSDATRLKMSLNSGIKGKFGGEHHNSKPVYAYRLDGTFYKKFSSRIEAARELSIPQADVVSVALGQNRFTGNWIFKNEFHGELIKNPVPVSKCLRPVICLNLDKSLFKEFESLTAAAKFFNTKLGTMKSACTRGTTHKGYKFYCKERD